MKKSQLGIVAVIAGVVLAGGRAEAQCAAFSSVTTMSIGSGCQPGGPGWCVPNLYVFHGSCSLSLALVGPSATFRVIGFGTLPGNGSALLPVAGGSCPLWIDGIAAVLDYTGAGLTQATFPAPPYSLAGVTLYAQALYEINCGAAGTFLGTTSAVRIQFQ